MRHGSRRHVRGLTLVELMISMLIGMIVVAGTVGIFFANSLTQRRTDDLSRIQESARAAFELMGRSLREAGGNACGVPESSITGLNGSDWWKDGPGLRGYAAGTFPAKGGLTPASGSDALVVISALQPADASQAGSVWLTCSHETGTGKMVSGNIPTKPSGGAVARVNAEGWFVATNADGGKSLYRTAFAADPEEIASDVASLKLTYRLAGEDAYKPASDIANDAWQDVVAVHVELKLERAVGPQSGADKIERVFAHTVDLRNRNNWSAQP